MTFSLTSRSKFEKEMMNSVLQVKRLNYKIKYYVWSYMLYTTLA